MNKTIIFVCEHGAAKSVVAAAHFNKLAKQNNIAIHAIARGTTPDEELAPPAVQGLSKDGLSAEDTKPTLLSAEDIKSAVSVISFCELSNDLIDAISVEDWSDTPPISTDYDKARDVILDHLNIYFKELNNK